MSIFAYKWVHDDLVSRPKDGVAHAWEIGTWYSVQGEIIPCENGFHASTGLMDVLEWTQNGTRLFIVEARGEIVRGDDKFAAREMRLVHEIANVPLIVMRFARLCARDAARAVRESQAAWGARESREVWAALAARAAREAQATRAAWAALAARAAQTAREAWEAWAARESRAATRRRQEMLLHELILKHGRGDKR